MHDKVIRLHALRFVLSIINPETSDTASYEGTQGHTRGDSHGHTIGTVIQIRYVNVPET